MFGTSDFFLRAVEDTEGSHKQRMLELPLCLLQRGEGLGDGAGSGGEGW